MKIKEFEAPTLRDCLNQVRSDLGPEAVILETQKVRRGGIMGWHARDAIKMTAAIGITVDEPPNQNRIPPPTAGHAQAAPFQVTRQPETTACATRAAVATTVVDPIASQKISRLEIELRELRMGMEAVRQSVNAAQPQAAVVTESAPSQFPKLYCALLDAEVPQELAKELLDNLPDVRAWSPEARDPLAISALRDYMAHRILSSGPISLTTGSAKVVALVGPTGVGKTTTVAKLAAQYALVDKCKVGLLTIDTYRIAAVEQLKTYGQIIDIPIKVAHSPSEVTSALESLAGQDLVLVDTAGRSQKNSMQIRELCSVLGTANIETHLVLAASTKLRDLNDQIDRFSAATRIDRLLFTKLDETIAYGTIFTVAASSHIPVSYITTGQKVPEDIELADGFNLADLTLQSASRQV